MAPALLRSLLASPLLVAVVHGSVSDVVVGNKRAEGEPVAQGQGEADTFEGSLGTSETPTASGESLVLCSGPYLCKGDQVWAGDVHACDEGLFCQQSAVLMMQGVRDGDVDSAQGASLGTATASSELAEAQEDDVVKMGDMEKQLLSSATNGLSASKENFCLFYCRGARVCRRWGWYLGRRTCVGGFYCRGW